MNLKNIINIIFYLLPEQLKNNKNFAKIKKIFLSNIYDNENYTIKVSNDIYNNLNIQNPNITTNNRYNNNLIFSFEYKDNIYIRFTIYKLKNHKNNEYAICFRKVQDQENELVRDYNIKLCIKKHKAKWEKVSTVIDNFNYYYDYDFNVFECDKNLNILPKNYEEKLNKNFVNTFYTPIQETPKYRLNFAKYREIINKYRIENSIKSIDEFFLKNENGIEFDGALTFDIFKDVILNADFNGTIEEDLYYDDDEFDNKDYKLTEEEYISLLEESLEENDNHDMNNIVIEKLTNIENNLIEQIGSNCEFIMSHNIINNIYNYITGMTKDILKTIGLLIKKEEDKYTLYYICIEPNRIITIPKNLTQSQIKIFYKTNVSNKDKKRIKEFFGIDNNLGRSLK